MVEMSVKMGKAVTHKGPIKKKISCPLCKHKILLSETGCNRLMTLTIVCSNHWEKVTCQHCL